MVARLTPDQKAMCSNQIGVTMVFLSNLTQDDKETSKKADIQPCHDIVLSNAVTRIRTWVTAATTQGTNHYTITASRLDSSDLGG